MSPLPAAGADPGDAVAGAHPIDAVAGADSRDAVTGVGPGDAVAGGRLIDAVAGAGLGDAVAGGRLIDAVTGARLDGARLTAAVAAVAAPLERTPPGAVLCLTGTDLGSVVRYLGVMAAGRPAILWDPAAPATEIEELTARFAPAAVVGLSPRPPVSGDRGAPAGYTVVDDAALGPAWLRRAAPGAEPHEQLSVLLGTSGSTGRPRLVRQSAAGVLASAGSVRAALDVRPDDVAVTTLPLFYTFGLSVLHSHLLAGATVVIDGRGLLAAPFWRAVDRYRVSAIAGVPHSYELLARKRWRPESNPSVRVLTVSGGRLRDELVLRFHEAMAAHGGRLYVMYGQTEAGSRICVLPPDALPGKLGSVGPPVPGMRLSIEGGAPDGPGEVVCHSAAVMMGYADRAEDLARGDDLGGTLRTGDRGRLDDDGYLWLSGRMSRIGKAYGVRVDLDAVERAAAPMVTAAAVAGEDRISLWCEGIGTERLADVAALVARQLRIHPSALAVTAVDRLPRRPNGKVDYPALPP